MCFFILYVPSRLEEEEVVSLIVSMREWNKGEVRECKSSQSKL